jgi:hypothetical protein
LVAGALNQTKSRVKKKVGRAKLFPPWKGVPRPPRHILEPSRIKRRLAFLIVTGSRNSKIRRELGITQKTLDQYLEHPDIEDAIQNMEQEIYTAAERRYQHLFIDSVDQMATILTNGSSVEDKLKAIDMTWRSLGRLQTGKGDTTNINAVAAAQTGGSDLERDDAQNIMQFLKLMKQKESSETVVEGAES